MYIIIRISDMILNMKREEVAAVEDTDKRESL